MKIALGSADAARLEHFCDLNGLDRSGANSVAALRALINRSGLVDDDGKIKMESEPAPTKVSPAARATTAAPAKGEAMTDITYQRYCATLASPEFDALSPAEKRARCIAYRDEMRLDPRNPYPGKYEGDTVRLLISEQDPKFYPGGDQPVWVGPNDREMYIPRGQVVDVPYAHAVVLHNCKTIVYESDDKRGLHSPREVAAYSFQVYPDNYGGNVLSGVYAA